MNDEVQKIKDKLSITEVVGQYVQLKKAGRNYSGRCPFHKERTPSFMVSPERGTYMCFGCGEKGDIFSFVERIEGIDFKTALKQLADKAGVDLPKYQGPTPQQKEKTESLREICEEATKFFEETLEKHADVQKYLESRGMSDETKKEWRVGYAPAQWEELSKHLFGKGYLKNDIADAGLAVKSEKKQGEVFDRFRGRIMFPIFDTAGAVIAFSGRFFEKVAGTREDGEPAKYVNSPETDLFKKSRTLYGLDKAKNAIRKADCILLVEGQFDVILSHQSGLPFTVAISGTALTPEHLSLLGRLSKRLVLALDNDEAGMRAGLKSAHMALAAGFDVKIPKIEGGKDPADLAAKNPELLKAAVRTSIPAVEFFLNTLQWGARDERAYKKLVEAQVLPLIAAIPSRIDQEHFIEIVARTLRVSEDAVRQEVAKKPNITEVIEEEAALEQKSIVKLSALERTVAILLFHFHENAEIISQLSALVGAQRLKEITAKTHPEAEKWRFEFDNLGEDETSTSRELLTALESFAIDEEIGRIKMQMHEAGFLDKGDPENSKRLMQLTRRREALRKREN